MTEEIVAQSQPEVVSAPVIEISTPERYYCSNCRETWEVSQVRKDPLDYGRHVDGTLVNSDHGRFSVFCKKCMKFLMIIDPSTKDKKTQFLGR
jgi:hypothetical protein